MVAHVFNSTIWRGNHCKLEADLFFVNQVELHNNKTLSQLPPPTKTKPTNKIMLQMFHFSLYILAQRTQVKNARLSFPVVKQSIYMALCLSYSFFSIATRENKVCINGSVRCLRDGSG